MSRVATSVLILAMCLVVRASGVSAQQQDPNVVVVRAMLDGGQEEPTKLLSGAHGMATLTLNRSARTIQYVIDAYNFPFRATAAHIHVGAPGTGAGPVIVNFTVPANSISAFRISGTAGVSDLVPRPAQGIQNFDDALFAIAAGVTYVNVHSEANPGGEIRGRLCVAPGSSNSYSGVNTCPN